MIRFGENTEDEVFISHEAATRGVTIENTGSEPLVGLRYFGPDVHSNPSLSREKVGLEKCQDGGMNPNLSVHSSNVCFCTCSTTTHCHNIVQR